MVLDKLQIQINRLINGLSAFEIVKWIFLIIPLLLIMAGGMFMGVERLSGLFQDPLTAVQVMLLLAMLFCYLIMKRICQELKDASQKNSLLLPLWLILLYQISSLNLICSFLLLYGMFREFGKKMFQICSFDVRDNTKTLLLGLLPLGFVYGLALFVKWRLNVW